MGEARWEVGREGEMEQGRCRYNGEVGSDGGEREVSGLGLNA